MRQTGALDDQSANTALIFKKGKVDWIIGEDYVSVDLRVKKEQWARIRSRVIK
jgi:hypothetical protein